MPEAFHWIVCAPAAGLVTGLPHYGGPVGDRASLLAHQLAQRLLGLINRLLRCFNGLVSFGLGLDRIQNAVGDQMRDIAEQTQMTVVLGAVSGGYCQYVRVIEGTTPIRYHVKAGTRRCLVRSTLGRVLLAMEPPEMRDRMIAEALAVWDGDEAPPPAEDVAGDLTQVSARGHAFHAGLVNENAAMLAIPLAVSPPARPLALGLAAPKDLFRGRRPELLGIMRDVLGSLGTPGQGATQKTA